MPDLGFQPTVPKRQKNKYKQRQRKKRLRKKKQLMHCFSFKSFTVAPTAVYCQPQGIVRV